jgi:hypothetical protein
MITSKGYSKDPMILPDGVAVTFGEKMIEEQGGLKTFLTGFKRALKEEDGYWMHKCKNRPQQDILYVYIIIKNRLAYRAYYGGYNIEWTDGVSADGKDKIINWPRINIAGPLEKCPFKRTLKGFQGFRYCSELW